MGHVTDVTLKEKQDIVKSLSDKEDISNYKKKLNKQRQDNNQKRNWNHGKIKPTKNGLNIPKRSKKKIKKKESTSKEIFEEANVEHVNKEKIWRIQRMSAEDMKTMKLPLFSKHYKENV